MLTSVCMLVGMLELGADPAAALQFGETGTQSGQLQFPVGVAVNQETREVYVSDRSNIRIDRFTGAGEFLEAWGGGVNAESPAKELQTCSALCQRGEGATGPGEFNQEGPHGVAVDNQPFSSSRGDVYVVDWESFRVEKYDAEGHFLLMFGGEVNEDKSDVCTVTENCQAGVAGTGDGQFEWAYQGNSIAVGPSGNVYVGDRARIEVFEPSGTWKESVALSALPSEGQVTQLTVDASGDMFLTDSEAGGVRELEPDGSEELTQFDAESFAVEALAVDGSGKLYVADGNGGSHMLVYDPAGKELASFGAAALSQFHPVGGLAFADTAGELYATNASLNTVVTLTPPPPGPLVEPGSESATPAAGGQAGLEAQVNPEGNATSYHFEYVDQAQFQASGYAAATSTAPVPIGSSFEDQLAQVGLPAGTLVPGRIYHWRVVASNECKGGETCTSEGDDQSFEELPAARVDGPAATNPSATSVTFTARIDPLGASTDYRLEYGRTSAYERVFTGNVGEGQGFVPISHHVQELEPVTTYHYRLVTSNSYGTVQGADHTFTTQLANGSQIGLPDGREWELVSPANTQGAVFQNLRAGKQAAIEGGAIVYPVLGTPLGDKVPGYGSAHSEVLSRREAGGWRSESINPPQQPLMEERPPGELLLRGATYALFSQDLARGAFAAALSTSLSPAAMAGTPYLRDNADQSYTPFLTPSDVWPGTTSLETNPFPFSGKRIQVSLVGATPDLSHVILGSPLKLTEEAVPVGEDSFSNRGNLYEWSNGELQLINRLPGTNEPTHDLAPVTLGGENGHLVGSAQRAISDDGRWVAWGRGAPPYGGEAGSYKGLYARDMVAGRTVQLGGPFSRYQTMNSDGSRMFFLEKGDLYEYATATDTRTNLTAGHAPGESSAGVQEAVSDVSKDGSYVYIVAKGVLASGGVSGDDNLYLLHDVGGAWSTTHIATLDPLDEPSWHAATPGAGTELDKVTSRVSPNGRYLAFMSQRPLTGYDNADAVSGQPDVEVYLYDEAEGRLVCASCNPTGARPVGLLNVHHNPVTGFLESPFVEHIGGEWETPPHWIAGSLPGWQLNTSAGTNHQPRYLSNSGRLFFNSPDALAPQDTNGLEDVYQYEPAGVGGCTRAEVSFTGRSDGCVGLISSGTSSAEVAFMDASESGDDVFFLSAGRLTSAAVETGYGMWDAHVCSPSAPCVPASASPPACSSGDSCKSAPTPQPELFGPAPSATFSGAGNIVVPAGTRKPPAPKSLTRAHTKSLTRAHKLTRALRACRKKQRKQRAACERAARKRFGAKHARNTTAIKRGGK